MSGISLSFTDDDVQTVLGDFLTTILPSTCEVLRAQQNRVAEPSGPDYCLINSTGRMRLSTNVDDMTDVACTGSVSGAVLTVTAMKNGTLAQGQILTGVGVADSTTLGTQITGTPGGVGTYNVTPSQTVTLTTLQLGAKSFLQATEATYQLDIHGPNSADNTQIISTLFRDTYAVDQFDGAGFNIAPLYAGEPRQAPFLDSEQQWDERWILEVNIQINPTVNVPQQFADQLVVGVISVNEAYPPT